MVHNFPPLSLLSVLTMPPQRAPVRIFSLLLGRVGWTVPTAMGVQALLEGFFRAHCEDFWFQLERGESTDLVHFQCYAKWTEKTRDTHIQSLWKAYLLSRMHQPLPFNNIKPAYDEGKQLKSYCFKEDTRVNGPWAMDATRLAEAVRKRTLAAAKKANADRMALREEDFAGITWRPWQQQLAKHLLTRDPHQRTIQWYYDPHGAAGKSTFCRYIAFKAPDRTLMGGYASARDLQHAVVEFGTPAIVLVDLTRSAPAEAGAELYSGLEAVKNGCFLSSKYKSGQHMQRPPHLVVFANFRPDASAMSKGRFDVIDLSNEPRAQPLVPETLPEVGDFKLEDYGKPVQYLDPSVLDTDLSDAMAQFEAAAAVAPAGAAAPGVAIEVAREMAVAAVEEIEQKYEVPMAAKPVPWPDAPTQQLPRRVASAAAAAYPATRTVYRRIDADLSAECEVTCPAGCAGCDQCKDWDPACCAECGEYEQHCTCYGDTPNTPYSSRY